MSRKQPMAEAGNVGCRPQVHPIIIILKLPYALTVLSYYYKKNSVWNKTGDILIVNSK